MLRYQIASDLDHDCVVCKINDDREFLCFLSKEKDDDDVMIELPIDLPTRRSTSRTTHLISQHSTGINDMMNESRFNHRRLLYKLMYRAFLEIRMAAHEGKGHQGIFKIADLFHNIPSILELADREGGNYEEIMQKLTKHADRNGSRPWLDHAIKALNDEVSVSS